ncbi:unnamed protein product [Sphagnum jensenii]|uniref:AB hydrolase-1 domain-containing protein n=1 Tax=Sphagnum jensenii TaxID=128206 RepID=A0ABP1BYT3_9BRYO
MEVVACRAFFPGAAAVVSVELRASLHDAPQQQGRSRSCSSGAILRNRRVQFSNNVEYYSRHGNVSTSRPGHLRILRLDKHCRTSNKFANTLLNFSSCSFSCSSSRDSRVQHHNSIIYAGLATGPGTADESKEADFASALQKIVDSTTDIGLSEGTRTVTITVCGVTSDNDLQRLQSQVLDLDGVGHASLGPFKEGGLRGGSVTMQIEVERRLPLSMLIQSIQALDEALLILPFKTNSWLWRGNKINYSVAGSGKPLILVHGFGGNVGHFARLIPLVAENYRVYAIDLLGFGASDKPTNVEYGPELWADLVCDFSEEFTKEGAVLFGNSIGSLTVLAAAAKAGSDLFKGIVLLNCAGAMNRKGLAQDGLALQLVGPIFAVVEYLLKKRKIANFLFNRFRSKENVKTILTQQAYRDKAAVTDHLVDILHHPSTDEGALDVFVKVFTGEPGPRPEALMANIDLPLLLLWGEKDPWTPANGPVAKFFMKLAGERDNLFVETLPDVGHCPHDDRPELAAGRILHFLNTFGL